MPSTSTTTYDDITNLARYKLAPSASHGVIGITNSFCSGLFLLDCVNVLFKSPQEAIFAIPRTHSLKWIPTCIPGVDTCGWDKLMDTTEGMGGSTMLNQGFFL